MSPLSALFGLLVGFSLGLTGGGGAIFAVPLLVYGLQVPSREAIGVSLITVGSTAFVGLLQRVRRGMVEFPTGILFAVAGMLTAPFGAWLAGMLPETVLLLSFGGLMLVIAARMWLQASRRQPSADGVQVEDNAGATCRRDPEGQLELTSPCALLLAAVGLATGILTGLFGVGGGFIIVPALIMFSGMGTQRAVGTSMLVVALVSLAGIASRFFGGVTVPIGLTLMFLTGSLAGLFAGTAVAWRLPALVLQQVFAAAIVGVGLFVIARNVGSY